MWLYLTNRSASLRRKSIKVATSRDEMYNLSSLLRIIVIKITRKIVLNRMKHCGIHWHRAREQIKMDGDWHILSDVQYVIRSNRGFESCLYGIVESSRQNED